MPVLAIVLVLLLIVFVVLPLIGATIWLVFSTVVVGLVLGTLGRLIVPGRQSFGWLTTIAVGIGGSLIGSLLGRLLDTGGFVTLLLQVAVAAGGVIVVESQSRRQVTDGRRRLSR